MKKTHILVIGRNEPILETVLRLINNHPEWAATGTSDDAAAMRLFTEQAFDLVLLGGGLDDACEAKLRAFFTEHRPGIKIVQHYGGGSGLLSNEILHALESVH